MVVFLTVFILVYINSIIYNFKHMNESIETINDRGDIQTTPTEGGNTTTDELHGHAKPYVAYLKTPDGVYHKITDPEQARHFIDRLGWKKIPPQEGERVFGKKREIIKDIL